MERPKLAKLVGSFVGWVRRSHLRRWWFRLSAWVIALFVLLRSLDIYQYATTGRQWSTFLNYESDSAFDRGVETAGLLLVSACVLSIAGSWTFSLRDLLAFGTACAVAGAFSTFGIVVAVILGIAVYQWLMA